MLIIDENTESKLKILLEELKEEPGFMRCVYILMNGKEPVEGINEKIIELVQQHIFSLNTHTYLCEDGDIFILAPNIPTKDARNFIIDVASFVKMPASENWIGVYEIAQQVNKLLAAIEQKIQKQEQIVIEQRKVLEKQLHERKRQNILNSGRKNKPEEIRNRRTNRNFPELMIIEDDTFSRRLVENVLQKRYSLTGLGEASNAIDIYARIAPDLLFLDINLPDVTGHELLEKILLIDPDAYVIMLSGNSDQANIVQAMSRGAKGFIAKPFTRDKLFQYIDRCPTINKHNQV